MTDASQTELPAYVPPAVPADPFDQHMSMEMLTNFPDDDRSEHMYGGYTAAEIDDIQSTEVPGTPYVERGTMQLFDSQATAQATAQAAYYGERYAGILAEVAHLRDNNAELTRAINIMGEQLQWLISGTMGIMQLFNGLGDDLKNMSVLDKVKLLKQLGIGG